MDKFKNDKINSLEEQILKELTKNNYLSIPELAKIINKSEPTIHRHINNLVKLNLLERVGSRKTGYWNVK